MFVLVFVFVKRGSIRFLFDEHAHDHDHETVSLLWPGKAGGERGQQSLFLEKLGKRLRQHVVAQRGKMKRVHGQEELLHGLARACRPFPDDILDIEERDPLLGRQLGERDTDAAG